MNNYIVSLICINSILNLDNSTLIFVKWMMMDVAFPETNFSTDSLIVILKTPAVPDWIWLSSPLSSFQFGHEFWQAVHTWVLLTHDTDKSWLVLLFIMIRDASCFYYSSSCASNVQLSELTKLGKCAAFHRLVFILMTFQLLILPSVIVLCKVWSLLFSICIKERALFLWSISIKMERLAQTSKTSRYWCTAICSFRISL